MLVSGKNRYYNRFKESYTGIQFNINSVSKMKYCIKIPILFSFRDCN